MIIMDFSKAFDIVPHNRLLNQLGLNRYGIRNKTHNWISNFLKYRKQRVVIGGDHTLHMDTSHLHYFRCTSRESTRSVTFSHLY